MKATIALALAGATFLLLSFLPWPSRAPQATGATSTPIAAGDPVRGQHLFVAKGCMSCHRHDDANPSSPTSYFGDGSAPILTDYSNDPAFLRQWLADPAAIRPGTVMPDLELDEAEIEALIAFLNAP